MNKTNWELMQEYAEKCGVKGITADASTLLLSRIPYRLDSLKEDFDYHVNPDYTPEVYDKKEDVDYSIYGSEGGVFVVDSNTKHLLLFAPIYECHGWTRRKNIISITGHEEAAVITLNALEDSFCEHTR